MTFLNFIKQILTENLLLKTTALALSFLMWLTITSDQPVEKVFSVRLEYHNIPDGMELSSPQIGSVDIYLRMPERHTPISEADFVAFVDLKDATPGEKVIHLAPAKNVRGPASIEILKLTPPRITLFLERTVQALIPIEPALDGPPADGYEVVHRWVNPTKIYVSGPESHVKRVISARTETVSINNRSALVKATVNINVDDPTIRILDTKPVEVTVDIQEKRREMLVEDVPVEILPEGLPVRLKPHALTLRISVPQSFNQGVQAAFFRATANVGELNLDAAQLSVTPGVEIKSDAPSHMRIMSVIPSALEVIPSGRKRPRSSR